MRNLTLSQRLFLVAAVALLPTLAILALVLVTLRGESERRLTYEAANSGRIATLEMNRIIGGVETVLRAVSTTRVVRDGDVQACNDYLSRVTETTPELSDMAIADAQGNVVCRSGTSRAAINVSDRNYFAAALAEGGPVTGTYSVGRLSGRATLPVAMPLAPDAAWPGGVIAVGLDLEWLGARLKERDFAQQSSLTIADREGRIIAREPQPERFVATLIPPAFMPLVTADQPGTLLVTSQDGTRRMIGYFPASDQTNGLYVSSGIATEPIYAATNRLMLQGIGVAVLGMLAALLLARFTSNYFIRQPFERLVATIEAWQRRDTATRTNMGAELAEFGRAGRALDGFMDQLLAARAERRKADHQRDVLARELDHRVKNILATVQAVARQTFRGKGSDDAVRTFGERLRTMAAAHAILMQDGWQAAPLADLIDETIAPFRNPQHRNFIVQGPDIRLGPTAAMSLSMALHELCTNAAKYGALGAAAGQVSIRWRIDTTADGDRTLDLTWVEQGGPAVSLPSARGFGSVMIEQVLAQQIGGTVDVAYLPQGLRCRIAAPMALVSPTEAGAMPADDPAATVTEPSALPVRSARGSAR